MESKNLKPNPGVENKVDLSFNARFRERAVA